jgi:ribokinase
MSQKKIFVLGSLNIDHVYNVDHFVQPGETLSSEHYEHFSGGKGLNQSVALSKAGAPVVHIGQVGLDGAWLIEILKKENVDTSGIFTSKITSTGQAIIQIDKTGENGILLYMGANTTVPLEQAKLVLGKASAGDLLLLQNETNGVDEMMRFARKKGLLIAFNPSPLSPEITSYPLDIVDIFILNGIEARGLTGETDLTKMADAMRSKFPNAGIVLTLGSDGAMYRGSEGSFSVEAEKVNAVDTTAAGDTFAGYFLAEFVRSGDVKASLELASRAAAICVTRKGASRSIPRLNDVRKK